MDSITTASSSSEGRLMDSMHSKKKKRMKSMIKSMKKDGCGGPGLEAPGYGSLKSVISSSPIVKYSNLKSTKKIKGSKKMKTLKSAISGLTKKLKFGKVVKSKIGKLKI